MRQAVSSRRKIIGALVGGVAVGLFVLQILLFATNAAFGSGRIGLSGSIAEARLVPCRAGGDDGDRAPASGDRAHCLINCCQNGRDEATAPAFVAFVRLELELPSVASIAIPLLFERAPSAPTGWASSWSSRTPPRVAS